MIASTPRVMRRSIAVLAGAMLALGPAACIRGHLPAKELYRLATPDSAATTIPLAFAPAAVAPGSIAIAPYETPGVYGDPGIVYRVDASNYGVYPAREWALPVGTMLGLMTQDVLARHPITARTALFDPPSYRTHDYVWRAIVRELEEVDRGHDVFAAVRFDARLVRARDDSVIWSGSARAERPVPQGTMPAIVDALSALSVEVIGRLADEARASLSASAASAARP